MPKQEKTYMPAGMGGLMRFGDEEEPLIKIQPKQIIYVIAGIVGVEVSIKMALHFL